MFIGTHCSCVSTSIRAYKFQPYKIGETGAVLLGLLLMEINITEIKGAEKVFYHGGGRKRLPKFKFSANFPIGLRVILQIQIKKKN